MILDDDRRHRTEVMLLEITYFGIPPFSAVSEIERNQMAVGRFEVQPVLIDPYSSIPNVNATFESPFDGLCLGAGLPICAPGGFPHIKLDLLFPLGGPEST